VLAGALPPDAWDVHFASARFDELVFGGTSFRRWPLHSLEPEAVERAIASGRRLYDEATLAGYAAEEGPLLAKVRPDVVVGDLRLSLTVSAPRAAVPCAALINGYWSPHAVRDGWPMPDHPIVRLLGERIAARYFPRALPRVFDHFAQPVNALRCANGLSAIGSLPEVMTYGDRVLFPDPPELVPTQGGPAHHVHLGPVLWSAPVPLPPWWSRLDPQRPTAYVTLGSSGRVDLLPLVLEALAAEGVQAMVATAGRVQPALPAHAHAADFLPGHLAARRADFVVTNGGSTTGYQALAEGRPVLGIAFNMDQYLAMTAIERAGAGRLLRAGSLHAGVVRSAARVLLADDGPRRAAARVAAAMARHDAAARFANLLANLAGASRGGA
jgi:UDP:flavonoid glycosyltransferase YjiC (YdhE family)